VTRTKQIVLSFFNRKSLLYTNYMPRAITVNAKYIMEALGKLMKTFNQKRPEMAAGDWCSGAHCCHGDRVDGGQAVPGLRAPALLTGFHPIQLLPLSQGDRELASLTLTQEAFKKEQEGAIRMNSEGCRLCHSLQEVV
jgi:hypothetical protein